MSYYHPLKQAPQFKQIYNSGHKLVFPEFVVYWLKAALSNTKNFTEISSTPLQLAFVASRKVGNAVARNRCKRRLRAAFYPYFKGLNTDNLNIVFVARRTVFNCTFAIIDSHMKKIIRKISEPKL